MRLEEHRKQMDFGPHPGIISVETEIFGPQYSNQLLEAMLQNFWPCVVPALHRGGRVCPVFQG